MTNNVNFAKHHFYTQLLKIKKKNLPNNNINKLLFLKILCYGQGSMFNISKWTQKLSN